MSTQADTPHTRDPIFHTGERSDPSPHKRTETTFQFYDRVEGAYWSQVRQLMQAWADHLDDGTYTDIRSRLRADEHDHRSAYLELFLHELFQRAGYTVTTHPHLAGSTRHPDMLVDDGQQAYYVEATSPGPTPAAIGAAAREHQLLQTIEGADNRNFYLQTRRLTPGPGPARGARARDEINAWLDTLNPDTPTNLDSAPTHTWEDQDWALTVAAIPVPPERRNNGHRILAIESHRGAQFIDDAPPMRKALAKKTRAYGQLDHPLIIALGTYTWDPDRWHITNALYGSLTYEVNTSPGQTLEPVAAFHDGTGYFGNPGHWRAHDVAAVLNIHQLTPYRPHQADLTLFPHPATDAPLEPLSARIPATTITTPDGQFTATPPARHAGEILGLPEPWPTGRAFPGTPPQDQA